MTELDGVGLFSCVLLWLFFGKWQKGCTGSETRHFLLFFLIYIFLLTRHWNETVSAESRESTLPPGKLSRTSQLADWRGSRVEASRNGRDRNAVGQRE